MELWIRSTAKTNLLKARFLTIMKGNNFYKENEWEYKGYTIANCSGQGHYELLGTYKTKKRALEVLDEIQNILKPKYILDSKSIKPSGDSWIEDGIILQAYNANAKIEQIDTYVYEMPQD